MLTAITQVLRWSALGFGVFYGAYHQLSLSAADRAKAAQKDWEHKESLIRQAKQQWARDHPTEQPKSSGGTSDLRNSRNDRTR
jgi:F-type H+-transporting ATP synthase subunit e